MDGGEESRFVCKLCSKKFMSGKSLGGHMRSHVVSKPSGKKGSKVVDESGNNGQSEYGLRENPKKTWRASVVDSGNVERVCKQCGKGFQSLKALCGHMACHSDKDRGLKGDDHSWTRGVMDRYSDTEDEERKMGFRSSNMCQKVVDECHFSLGNNNESSSVSEIDGQADVEVAMCLMLLSTDCGNKHGVNSVVESSDNNSVVLETKSASVETRIGNKESMRVIHGKDDEVKKFEHRKLKDGCNSDGKIARMGEDSDSGYFLDECAKAESDVSVDGLQRRGNTFSECRKPVVEMESSKAIKNRTPHLGKRERSSEIPGEAKSAYRCLNDGRTCKSHRRSIVSYESRYESGENSLDGSADKKTAGKVVESSNNRKGNHRNSPKKKIKLNKNEGHVCPFCNKAFKNGQALGGHKRSHLIENKNNDPSPVLFDLNLPAPEADDDDDELSQFVC